ncbi:HFM1 [Cordylochernes scorpioides]|uniref:DNA 3'-5' helicase n=1 Tax=Cordylochernes scorpioides TaxID=51811 RepID=A0ABY6LFY6_9ARAC|nr:HFM1 [Cordylochernes scorpioides]
MKTDKHIIVNAPTGSGKTVIFELAIIRLLTCARNNPNYGDKCKAIYIAPIKALCRERYSDWCKKFGPLGIYCLELTGDSDLEDHFNLHDCTILLTTPEKLDNLTRVCGPKFLNTQLILIDEVHLLNDDTRGHTMEAVITRMKLINNSLKRNSNQEGPRFIAVSATITNAEDIAEWVSSPDRQGMAFKMDSSIRPVKLKKIVLGYPFEDNWSEFKFDISLNYKLRRVISQYSDGLSTLIFCSTRKSVVQCSILLSRDVPSSSHRQRCINEINSVKDNKLRDCLLSGIGFHHAGLDMDDRHLVEELFLKGEIKILISTSTLAMGVNLPAHLVIIKSTSHYVNGCTVEYSDTEILQMMGRAGRPQFDTHATVVIMTKTRLRTKYLSLIEGTNCVESSLHKHLVEHLNAEIVLNTIVDVSIAMEWIRSTFLYIRIMKNPTYYNVPGDYSKEQIEKHLQDLCLNELNGLAKFKIIQMDEDGFSLRPLNGAYLMAKYSVAFETMKLFSTLNGDETLEQLVEVISSCKEFADIALRASEKKTLNMLNKNKNKSTIRFPFKTKITTRVMKINCLIQAAFDCFTIYESSLNQDMSRITRLGVNVAKCLSEFLFQNPKGAKALVNAVVLAKCFKARLWENSKLVSRQLNRIGPALSEALVNARLTTFEALENANPRELETILNRNPPFGTQLRESAAQIPKYQITVEQGTRLSGSTAVLSLHIAIKNRAYLGSVKNAKLGSSVLIISDKEAVVYKQRLWNSQLLKMEAWTKSIHVQRKSNECFIDVDLINESYVGIDFHSTYKPHFEDRVNFSTSYFKQTYNTNKEELIPQVPKTKPIKEPASHQSKSLNGIDQMISNLHAKSEILPQKNFKMALRNPTFNRNMDTKPIQTPSHHVKEYPTSKEPLPSVQIVEPFCVKYENRNLKRRLREEDVWLRETTEDILPANSKKARQYPRLTEEELAAYCQAAVADWDDGDTDDCPKPSFDLGWATPPPATSPKKPSKTFLPVISAPPSDLISLEHYLNNDRFG